MMVARSAPGGDRETIKRSGAEFDAMAEDSFAYRVLESLQELGGEIGGFVEMEAVGRGFVVPVSIGSLELRPGEGLAPGVP